MTARDRADVLRGARAFTIVAAALAPDLDLLLKYVDGQNHHQGASHSLGAALLAGLVVSLVAAWRRDERPVWMGLLAMMGWGSHVLLDYLGRDTHPPIGLLALWPVADGYYKFPWPVFLDIGRSFEWTAILHNSIAVAWELVILLPIPALLLRRRLRAA